MPKPTCSAKQLHQLLIERIEAIPDLAGQVTDVHRGGVVGTGGGSDGEPNWTVPVLTDRGTHRADIARIIRTLQGSSIWRTESRDTSCLKPWRCG